MPSKTRSITFEIPDYVDLNLKDLHLFYGREVIARKLRGQSAEVKIIRCNFCGLCCSNLKDNHFFGVKEDGTCEFLKWEIVHHQERTVKGWFCKHKRGDSVPFSCCVGRGTLKECVIKFKKVE